IRSVYRVIEFAQGHDGYLISHEVFMFILDAVPLILAIGVWAVFWPTVLIDRIAVQTQGETQMHSMGADSAQLFSAVSNQPNASNKSYQGLINA
ncbi:hypothetical protein BGZ96_005245, partial [Linnemannia gamsii]